MVVNIKNATLQLHLSLWFGEKGVWVGGWVENNGITSPGYLILCSQSPRIRPIGMQ